MKSLLFTHAKSSRKYHLFALFILITSLGKAQTKIIFEYDEAGNQIIRKTCTYCRGIISPPPPPQKDIEVPVEEKNSQSNEDPFWKGVRIYPVPVKELLTIDWDTENDALIHSISLFENNRMAFLFEQNNSPNLNRQIQFNMSGYYMGVYVLTFSLKDGRKITKNIIKE
ncbi:MAG: hypothetical protein KBA33_07810 [Cloacibacterium sp.]|nr:hypothetical protein [Cloacibacterium sp.]